VAKSLQNRISMGPWASSFLSSSPVGFGDLDCVVQEVDEDMCRLLDENCKVVFVDRMGWI